MSKNTLLVVDDDTKLLAILRKKFAQADYDVLLARDGKVGLDAALKKHPDLILLDLRMPRMDGEAMLKQLRKDVWGKTVPVIALTNSDSGHTMYLNIKDDLQGYYVKAEVSLKDLLIAVQDHIDTASKKPLPKKL